MIVCRRNAFRRLVDDNEKYETWTDRGSKSQLWTILAGATAEVFQWQFGQNERPV